MFATLNYTKTADPGLANELYLLPLPFPPICTEKKNCYRSGRYLAPRPIHFWCWVNAIKLSHFFFKILRYILCMANPFILLWNSTVILAPTPGHVTNDPTMTTKNPKDAGPMLREVGSGCRRNAWNCRAINRQKLVDIEQFWQGPFGQTAARESLILS